MEQVTPETFSWAEWDWRPLARLVGWISIAVFLTHVRLAAPLALLGQALGALILLSVLSFGVLTHLLLFAAMGALRLAMVFDDAAYTLAERIVRPSLGRAPFTVTFIAAFGTEIVLVFGAGSILRAVHADERLWNALSGLLR
jgi:hypothetical protein